MTCIPLIAGIAANARGLFCRVKEIVLHSTLQVKGRGRIWRARRFDRARVGILPFAGAMGSLSTACALFVSFGLVFAQLPGAVSPFDHLAQSLEAWIVRRSTFEVGKNPDQRDARSRPIVDAFLRYSARVADRPPHDFSSRGRHGASYVLSGALPA